MTTDKSAIKIVFGLLIFMFSLALAYFTASYLGTQGNIDYWTALLIFAGVYIALGAAIYHIFAVILGFLFASDVLILHLMLKNFGSIPSPAKTIIIGAVLVILYLVAGNMRTDLLPPPPAKTATPPPTSPPVINNPA